MRVWRPDIRQTTIVNGTVRTPNLDVLMRYKRGNQLTIVGTNIPTAAQKFGSAIGAAELPPIVGEASGTLWADRNLKPGLVRPWAEGGYGLFVYIETITYRDKVIQGPVAVSSNVPGSSDERRLAVITWDVSAADFVVVNGTATTTSTPFTLENYVAIPLGDTDRLRLGAVELVNGQTTVAADNFFIQERDWLTLHADPAGTVAAEDVTYDNATSGLSATDAQAAIDDIAATVGGLGAYIHIQDQKAQNASGGSATSGAWTLRDLNTEVADTGSHASLSSNQVTLDAGTYRIRASAPFFGAVGRNRLRWRNTSDSTDAVVGQNFYGTGNAVMVGRFTIASTKTFELQYRLEANPGGSQVLGVESNWTGEIYAEVELWKE